jgi:spore coat polysaccharide biosynthesis protein SpsF
LFSELGRNFSLTDPAGLSALLARYPWLAAINAENVQR